MKQLTTLQRASCGPSAVVELLVAASLHLLLFLFSKTIFWNNYSICQSSKSVSKGNSCDCFNRTKRSQTVSAASLCLCGHMPLSGINSQQPYYWLVTPCIRKCIGPLRTDGRGVRLTLASSAVFPINWASLSIWELRPCKLLGCFWFSHYFLAHIQDTTVFSFNCFTNLCCCW